MSNSSPTILTIGDLIAHLRQIEGVYGSNLPICLNNENVGYLQGVYLHIVQSTQIDEGLYEHPTWRQDAMDVQSSHLEETGDETIAVIDWCGTGGD